MATYEPEESDHTNAMPRLTPMRWFVVLAAITIGLALVLPPDPHTVQQLHTTPTAFRLAIAALLIPYVVIWYLSFFAFDKLQCYSRPLRKSQDGAAFHTITAGMGALSFSLVLPTTLALILNEIAAHDAGFTAPAAIINNYTSIFPALVSFLIIYNGARELVRTTKGAAERLDLRWYTPWYLLLSVVFSHLTIGNQYRLHPYHLPLWLLIVSIIVPYLYAWAIGLLTTYALSTYAKTVSGLLYRKAVRQFAHGIAVTIFGSIAIQFVNITLAKRFSHSLGAILLIDYLLLTIVAVGLGLMALGTKKLQRIEEI